VTREQIHEFLKLVGSAPASNQSRSGWVIARCCFGPWHHAGGDKHPSFGVRIEAGDSFATCFSCGWHGRTSDIVLELRMKQKAAPVEIAFKFAQAAELVEQAEQGSELNLDTPDIEQILFGTKVPDYVFPDDWLATFAPAWSIGWARDYLLSRQVPEEIANALDLRADIKLQRVCFPIRDFKDRLRGLHGRAVDPDASLRYRMYPHKGTTNPEIWLGEHWVEFDKPLLMVEGTFDLTSVLRLYRNAVTPLFANPSFAKLKRMSDALEIITLFDCGTGGDKGRARISQAYPHSIVTHLILPESKDPGAAPLDELQATLQEHLPLDEIIY
jgi:DNA primase